MSDTLFLKGECRHCGGHLEFPAAAAGESVECPHCGQPTELAGSCPPKGTSKPWRWWMAMAATVLVLLAAGLFYFWKQAGHTVVSKPGSVGQTNVSAVVVEPAKPRFEATTNEFAVMPFKLETKPGSSLVYVTGTVQNLADRQRFGVKVSFQLFDEQGTAVGSASDYQPMLEPHGEWKFKALVMESKTVAARFDSIHEER